MSDRVNHTGYYGAAVIPVIVALVSTMSYGPATIRVLDERLWVGGLFGAMALVFICIGHFKYDRCTKL